MKDEQKVFIRGVEGRGDEVIKMLTNLGATEDAGFEGDDPECLYFINHMGFVDYTSTDTEIGQILMGCYTELHLPEKWKDGDVLVTGEGLFFVLKGDYQVGDKDATIGGYCCVSEHQVCLSGHFSQIDSPHLASPSEVEHFYELMHKYGKDWDAERKQIVDWQWKPKIDEPYYYIDNFIRVVYTQWNITSGDKELYKVGNCFRTREKAEVMAETIKKLLKGEQL